MINEFLKSIMDYTYLGNFSATPPQYDRDMSCHKCKVRWTGCWDNFMCPKCGEGDLPAYKEPLNPRKT